MMRGLLAWALATALCFGTAATAQQSKAAAYLMAQELADACPNGGAFQRGGFIETDLTGDGARDLIVAHEMIRCKAPASARSQLCGMQVCTVRIYVREGKLLRAKADFLGGGVTVGPTSVPVISGYAHGGDAWAVRWDGRRFR